MGVSLPGAPGIITGFNDHISWGVTNGYDDVMDWYDIQFKDSTMTEYFHDNKWKPTRKVVEKFKIRGGMTFNDTITFTHHGPIVWDTPYQTLSLGEKSIRNSIRQVSTGRALRWLAHDESNELRTFYLLNTAKNYDDFVHALEFFNCPGQNFAYADVEGNIALWHAGNNPAKWEKQGMFISDGTDPRYDWQAVVPHDQKPHVKNPKRGYIGSANQHPTTSDYPYFLSEFYWASFRWNQIHTRLDTLHSASINDMFDIQLDNRSVFAEKTMPIILRTWKDHLKNDLERQTFTILSDWDYEMDGHSPAPTMYRYWYAQLEVLTWEDDLGKDNDKFIWPYRDKMMELILTNPESHWFDNKSTTQIETFSHLSRKAFHTMVSELQKIYGDDISTDWIWAKHQGTDINHVANIPGMGVMGLPTSGGSDIPNATGTTFGPSWRFVVDMGETKSAYGIYPGGQSGFPGSKYYDNMVDDWVNGVAYPLSFPDNPAEISGETIILGNGK
jgi:penicillin amidase